MLRGVDGQDVLQPLSYILLSVDVDRRPVLDIETKETAAVSTSLRTELLLQGETAVGCIVLHWSKTTMTFLSDKARRR